MSKKKLIDISNLLNVNPAQLSCMIQCGLLGYTDKDGVPSSAGVESYLRYGTQWTTERRNCPEEPLPSPAGWENPPLSTLTQQAISQTEPTDESTVWIAHFYFRTNHFFFPCPEDVAPVGPCRVLLDEKKFIEGGGSKIGIYPDPDGRLALMAVTVEGGLNTQPLQRARTLINPILSHLTTLTDHPLPIVQQLLLGFPHGEVVIQRQTTAPTVKLKLEDFTTHQPLDNAEYLYRLALTVNDPTYSYLSFWRAIEAVNVDLGSWVKRNGIKPVGYGPTKLPNHMVYGEWSGLKLNDVINKMSATKRNGIAHGGQDGIVITGVDFTDIEEIQRVLPTLRFIAKAKIEHFKYNLQMAKATSTNPH